MSTITALLVYFPELQAPACSVPGSIHNELHQAEDMQQTYSFTALFFVSIHHNCLLYLPASKAEAWCVMKESYEGGVRVRSQTNSERAGFRLVFICMLIPSSCLCVWLNDSFPRNLFFFGVWEFKRAPLNTHISALLIEREFRRLKGHHANTFLMFSQNCLRDWYIV